MRSQAHWDYAQKIAPVLFIRLGTCLFVIDRPQYILRIKSALFPCDLLKNGSRRFAESQRDIPPRHIAHCDLLGEGLRSVGRVFGYRTGCI